MKEYILYEDYIGAIFRYSRLTPQQEGGTPNLQKHFGLGLRALLILVFRGLGCKDQGLRFLV